MNGDSYVLTKEQLLKLARTMFRVGRDALGEPSDDAYLERCVDGFLHVHPHASGILSDPGVQYVEIDGKRVWEKADANGWMPIETAPKDGTEIWAYTPERGGIQFKTLWGPDYCKDGWGPIDSCCGYYEDMKPTHWKPLPDPPA